MNHQTIPAAFSASCASFRIDLLRRGHELPVAGEIDFLGIRFLGPERFRARETALNRLLREIRSAIVARRGK